MPYDTWFNLPEEKRERIVSAAMAEFGTRGFSAGSLNVVAREAGVAKGSLFQYFADKRDLFSTVADITSARIEHDVISRVDVTVPDFFDLIRDLLRTWVAYFTDHPAERAMAFAMANEIDDEIRHAVREVTNRHYESALRPLIEAGQSNGSIRSDVDVAEILSLIVLLMRHLNSAPFDDGSDPWLRLDDDTPGALDDAVVSLVNALQRAYSGAA